MIAAIKPFPLSVVAPVGAVKLRTPILSTTAAGIYVIRNSVTGKCYVGSAANIKKRFSQHRSALSLGNHHNHHLQASWNKHGADSFSFEVLEICQDWTKAIQVAKENHWVKELRPEYNLTVVAESSLGVKRSNETRERMVLAAEIRRQKWARSMFVHITGSLATAVVLEQIMYWHSPDKNGRSRLRTRYAEDYWLAKSRQEMMEETGVSLKQYQAAVTKLSSMKIIDYRIGGFNGKPTPFIRLDIDRLADYLHATDYPGEGGGGVGAIVSSALKGNKPLLPFGTNLCAKRERTNTDSTTDNTTEEGTYVTASPSHGILATLGIRIPTGESPDGEDTYTNTLEDLMPKMPTTANAILKQFREGPVNTPKVPENSTRSAEAIWRKIPQFNDTVKFMGALTIKDRGYLSYIAKRLGPTSDLYLNHLISHWVGYAKFVASQRGLKLTPNAPDLGFLKKYVDDAVSFVAQEMGQASQPVKLISSHPARSPVTHVGAKTSTPTTMVPAPPKKVFKISKAVKAVPPGKDSAMQIVNDGPGEEAEASLEDILAWADKLKT